MPVLEDRGREVAELLRGWRRLVFRQQGREVGPVRLAPGVQGGACRAHLRLSSPHSEARSTAALILPQAKRGWLKVRLPLK